MVSVENYLLLVRMHNIYWLLSIDEFLQLWKDLTSSKGEKVGAYAVKRGSQEQFEVVVLSEDYKGVPVGGYRIVKSFCVALFLVQPSSLLVTLFLLGLGMWLTC